MPHSWSISVHKDNLKFSAAHFLIFQDGHAEKLHGHNYKVFVELRSRLDEHGLVLNFRSLKPLIREVVLELDECLLLPAEHPVLRVNDLGDGSTEVVYKERRYIIPTDEIVALPINNTSSENLARVVCERLIERLRAEHGNLPLQDLIVGVEETAGQQGVFHYREDRDGD